MVDVMSNMLVPCVAEISTEVSTPTSPTSSCLVMPLCSSGGDHPVAPVLSAGLDQAAILLLIYEQNKHTKYQEKEILCTHEVSIFYQTKMSLLSR